MSITRSSLLSHKSSSFNNHFRGFKPRNCSHNNTRCRGFEFKRDKLLRHYLLHSVPMIPSFVVEFSRDVSNDWLSTTLFLFKSLLATFSTFATRHTKFLCLRATRFKSSLQRSIILLCLNEITWVYWHHQRITTSKCRVILFPRRGWLAKHETGSLPFRLLCLIALWGRFLVALRLPSHR